MIFFKEFYKNKNRFFTTLGLLILFLPFVKSCSSEKRTGIVPSQVIAKTSIKKPIDSLNTAIYFRDTLNDSIYYFKYLPVKKERKLKLWDESFVSGYRLGYLGLSFLNFFNEDLREETNWNSFIKDIDFFFSVFLITITIFLYAIGFIQTFLKPKIIYNKYYYAEIFILISIMLFYYITSKDDLIFKKVLYGFWLFLINNSILVYYNYKAYKNQKSH